MAIAKKKGKIADPISDRARALNDQIAALESEIKKLDSQLQHATAPRFRSTALPHGATIARKPEPPPAPKPAVREPVFEEVNPIQAGDDTAAPDQFNELGVRKYDLPALITSFAACSAIRPPPTRGLSPICRRRRSRPAPVASRKARRAQSG